MKVKDIQVGRGYMFQNSKWSESSVYGDGLVYVLSTSATYRTEGTHGARGETRKILPHEDRTLPLGAKGGLAVIYLKVWGSNAPTAQDREVLSKVTLEDVARAGWRLPEEVRLAVPCAELTVAQPRYLVGDWDDEVEMRKESERRAEEIRKEHERKAADREQRWSKILDAVEELTGETRNWKTPGDDYAQKFYLDEMEKLVELARLGRAHQSGSGTG